MRFLIAIGALLMPALCAAQEKDCETTPDDNSKYIKFNWSNDALKLRGSTDRYFTNGNTLEYFYLPPRADRYEKIFFRMPCSPTRNNNFSVGFNMQMFTPQDITIPTIIADDRPYAGMAMLFLKCISNEFATSDRISTEYGIGIIGQKAFQKEVQTWFHDLIESPKPMGWDHQIKNDLAVNVKVDYEKGVARPNKNLEVIGMVESNFGTVTNFMGLGSTIRIGSFNDYFVNELGLKPGSKKLARYRQVLPGRKYFEENLTRDFQFYFFIRSSLRVVIDNTLLQGGLFSYNDSPYVLGADQLRRFYLNAEFAVNLTYKGVGLVYSQLFRTPEFDGAFNTHWGSFYLIFRIRPADKDRPQKN